MKTRTLLLLAVASGLVILIAGGIWLVLFVIANENPPVLLEVGESATIGDMTVSVLTVDHVAGETYIGVRLEGVDDPDGATSWVLGVVGDQLGPLAPPASIGPACEATSAAEPTECVLAFRTDAGGVLTYGRADETIRWDIPA